MNLSRSRFLSKESLDLILANMNEGVMVVNEDYIIEYMNRPLRTHFGNQIGKKCYQTISHHNYPCHLCPVREIIKKHHRYFETTTVKDAHGQIYEIEAFPIRDQDGTKKVVEIVRDITEKYTSAAELLNKEQFLANITRFSKDAIIAVTSRGKFSFWNKGAEELFGYTTREMLGKSISKLVLQGRKKFKDLGENIIKKGSVKNYLTKAVKKNGAIVPISITASTVKNTRHKLDGFSAIITDITHMRRYEEALEKERNKLEDIFEGSGDGISIIDRKFRIQYMNKFMKRIYSHKVLGKVCYKAFNNREEICPWCPVTKTFKTGKNAIGTAKDRHGEYMEIKTSPMRDEKGEVIAAIEIVRNVSTRVKMQKEIARYQHMVENSFDGIMIIDMNRIVTYSNQAGARIFGYSSPKELIDRHDSIFGLGSRDEKVDRSSMITETVNKKGRWIGEVVSRKKDGSYVDVQLSITLLKDKDGKPIGHAVIAHDITKQKRRQEQIDYLANIVSQSQAPVFTIDYSGSIITSNSACHKLSGFNQEEILGLPIVNLIPGINSHLECTFKEGKCIGQELELVNKNGEKIPINLSTFVLKNREGEIINMAGFIEDIREKKQLQERLSQHERLAAIGRLAAGLAHEINNPLLGIMGLTQILLQNEEMKKQGEKELTSIEQEVYRCVRIIENLTYFAQPPETVKMKYNINTLIDEILENIKTQPNCSAINIVKKYNYVPKIAIDYGQMHQALGNILFNACFATQMECGRVKVSTTLEKEHDQRYVKVQVEDNGRGIDQDTIQKVFDPFFSSDQGWKGMGLNLSVSYSIIQAHHGIIDVASQPGVGSVFTVKLPIS
jgi:PAS domain S-box-containing protein